jgi:hypothetical protein
MTGNFCTKRLAATGILLLAASFPALSAGTGKASVAGPFLCIVGAATGFAFDSQAGSWRGTNFTGGEKLIIRRNDQQVYEVMPGIRMPVSGIWAVWTFGDNHWPTYTCAGDFSEYGYLHCESSLGEKFSFNLTNGRFITESTLGYIQAGMSGYLGIDGKPLPEGSNTTSITIGKCSAI